MKNRYLHEWVGIENALRIKVFYTNCIKMQKITHSVVDFSILFIFVGSKISNSTDFIRN